MPGRLEIAHSIEQAEGAREPEVAGMPPPIQAESPRPGAGRPPRARGSPSQHSLSRSGLNLPLPVSPATPYLPRKMEMPTLAHCKTEPVFQFSQTPYMQ